MVKNPDGTLPYKNFVDCAMKTAKNEGILRFWAGLPTYIFRIAPHVMIVNLIKKLLLLFIDTCCIRILKEKIQVKKILVHCYN